MAKYTPQKKYSTRSDDWYDDLEDIYGEDKPKKKRPWLTAIIIVVVVLAIIALAGYALIHFMFGGLRHGTLERESLAIVQAQERTEIKNIALIGTTPNDFAQEGDPQDIINSVIVASLDPLTDEIKLTSIHLDSIMLLESGQRSRLRGTYTAGGPQLLIKTLNDNFQLDISDYIKFNFAQAGGLIDSLGGLEMDVTASEVAHLTEKFPDRPFKEGPDLLDGNHTRIVVETEPSGDDYYQIGKPQSILVKIIDKINSASLFRKLGLIREFLRCMETSLSNMDFIKLALGVNLGKAVMIENAIPDLMYETNVETATTKKGQPVCVYDREEAVERLHHIIYGAIQVEVESDPNADQEFDPEQVTDPEPVTTAEPKSEDSQDTDQAEEEMFGL